MTSPLHQARADALFIPISVRKRIYIPLSSSRNWSACQRNLMKWRHGRYVLRIRLSNLSTPISALFVRQWSEMVISALNSFAIFGWWKKCARSLMPTRLLFSERSMRAEICMGSSTLRMWISWQKSLIIASRVLKYLIYMVVSDKD